MSRVEGQPAFVLHTRPYRDTSVLVDFFCPEYGLVRALARGAKRPKSRWRSLLQPFIPLTIGWQGLRELKTLTLLESAEQPLWVSGNALWCGLYLNELLVRLLQVEDPHPQLYAYYQFVAQELAGGLEIEPLLRIFEMRLIQELGYGFSLTHDALGGEPLGVDRVYRFDAESGFFPVSPPLDPADRSRCFYGRDLLAIGQELYDSPRARQSAKRLMRLALDPLLGGKPLKSRELFQRSTGTTSKENRG